MADVLSQSQFMREAPELEAQKLALLESAKAQTDATNLAAKSGQYLTPDYQIAGLSENQTDAPPALRLLSGLDGCNCRWPTGHWCLPALHG